MADCRTLREFVAHLTKGVPLPLPPAEEWKEHVERISVPGRIVEVSDEQYWYWLEVLPPHFQRGLHFCFAEGAEAFRRHPYLARLQRPFIFPHCKSG